MKDKKMLKNKIMVVTTGRADYGLLYPLIKKTIKSELIELQLIATGTHLSSLHGKTIQLIEEDNEIQVTDKVEMTMEKDTEDAICTSIATGLMGFSQLFNRLCPDLLVVLGDRYELWSACMAAVIHKIPIAQMSAFHFASIDLYAKRIIQMGENPEKVFVVGAIGLDNIKSIPLMSRQELSKHTQIDFKKKIALMTYHPVTLDRYDSAEKQIQEVLNALIKTDLLVLMTMPNSDTSGSVIYQKIKKYSQQYPEKFRLIKNLGQKGYLSAMKYAQLMIGNSSSGIIESASFKLPVVNIGDRQAGRLKSVNIIDCDCSQEAIVKAVNRALLDEFKQSIAHLKSPYGDGNTSTHIVKILESIDLKNKSQFLKKGFYDLKCDLSQINPTRMI
jgi:UDP-N-acetylglucosamine 2-epimerase